MRLDKFLIGVALLVVAAVVTVLKMWTDKLDSYPKLSWTVVGVMAVAGTTLAMWDRVIQPMLAPTNMM